MEELTPRTSSRNVEGHKSLLLVFGYDYVMYLFWLS
jgi:hypothetical protein